MARMKSRRSSLTTTMRGCALRHPDGSTTIRPLALDGGIGLLEPGEGANPNLEDRSLLIAELELGRDLPPESPGTPLSSRGGACLWILQELVPNVARATYEIRYRPHESQADKWHEPLLGIGCEFHTYGFGSGLRSLHMQILTPFQGEFPAQIPRRPPSSSGSSRNRIAKPPQRGLNELVRVVAQGAACRPDARRRTSSTRTPPRPTAASR
jgi:hypothetical protein